MAMRWEDERYVRVYTRDTIEWEMLCWQARCLMPLILRKVDRAGLLGLGKHGARGLAASVKIPVDVVTAGLNGDGEQIGLIESGAIEVRGEMLVVPNFIAAQETPSSDAQRKRDQREKAAALTKLDEANGGAPIDTGVVYFARSESGEFKIGYTTNIRERLWQLNTGRADKLTIAATEPGGIERERELQARFAEYKIDREWFRPGTDLVRYIDSLDVAKRDLSKSQQVTDGHSVPYLTVPSRALETHTAAAPLELVPVAAESSFDFASVYNAYPRKEGKTKGIARLRSQVRTPEAFEQLKRAIGHYAEKVKAEGTDSQF